MSPATYTCTCGAVWDKQTVVGSHRFELLDPEDELVSCPQCNGINPREANDIMDNAARIGLAYAALQEHGLRVKRLWMPGEDKPKQYHGHLFCVLDLEGVGHPETQRAMAHIAISSRTYMPMDRVHVN